MIKIDYTTLSKNPLLGFYQVKDQIYWDKASALMGATKAGLKFEDLHWNFNDMEFGSFDWSIEPPGDIRDYYYARAREIREKYDYIILNCSGGADSTTMLYSFINQGLHVDEVFVRHATAGTNKYQVNNKDFDARNEFSEFEHAALPLLKWLKNVSPNTKITVHDFSLDIIDDNLTWDENFIYWCGDYVTPGCIVRYTHAKQKDSLEVFDKGKKIGILFGTDKPKLYIDNNQMYLKFTDRVVHTATPAAVNNGYENLEVELFYWHPSSRAMIAKQCHMVRRWLEHPVNARMQYMFDTEWQSWNRTAYEALVKGIIYPDYDLSTFQCHKPTRAAYQEWDYWMEDFRSTAGYKTFMRGYTHLYRNIDKSFIKSNSNNIIGIQRDTAQTWEYRMCYSHSYKIGTIKKEIVI